MDFEQSRVLLKTTPERPFKNLLNTHFTFKIGLSKLKLQTLNLEYMYEVWFTIHVYGAALWGVPCAIHVGIDLRSIQRGTLRHAASAIYMYCEPGLKGSSVHIHACM